MAVVGSQDHLQCLVTLPPGAAEQFNPLAGGPLCLGYRYTVEWAGFPIWVADHGYIVTNERAQGFYSLDQPMLDQLRAVQGMPPTLPSYAVPTKWRALVFGSWAIVALLLAVIVWRIVRRRTVAKLRTQGLSGAVPVAKYIGDRKLVAAIAPLLNPNETVSHYALTYDQDMRHSSSVASAHKHIVALTNQRMLMVITKAGLLGMGAGVPKHLKFDRADIAAVQVIQSEGGALQVQLHSGQAFGLYVPLTLLGYSSSNQMAFARDLPLLFPDSVRGTAS